MLGAMSAIKPPKNPKAARIVAKLASPAGTPMLRNVRVIGHSTEQMRIANARGRMPRENLLSRNHAA